MVFEWDPAKAESNLRKHGVGFAEAASVFVDPLAVTYRDPDHSVGGSRFVTLGHAKSGRLLFVSHQDVDEDHVRLISVRPATKRESHDYRESS